MLCMLEIFLSVLITVKDTALTGPWVPVCVRAGTAWMAHPQRDPAASDPLCWPGMISAACSATLADKLFSHILLSASCAPCSTCALFNADVKLCLRFNTVQCLQYD